MCPATHGADRVIETLAAGGVDVCFTNPGTSEMQLVAAFDRMGGVRPILTLFEGVAAGAADGFGRMLDRPASTLLHTGPGLANGLANFHNARKARTPIVSLVGDHAIRHRSHDAPLSADVEAFAQPVSGWVRTTRRAEELAEDVRAALDAATRPPGRIATLIIPANCAWEPAGPPARPTPPRKPLPPSSARVEQIAEILRSDAPSAILLAGRALRAHGLETAGRIAASCGVRPFCPTFAPRVERGAGRVAVEPLPYFAETALAALAGTRHLVLVGAASPVAFFAYPDKPSVLLPEGCETSVLSHPEEDGVAALEALAEALGATRLEPERVERPPTPAPLPAGPLTPEAIHRSLAALLPEAAIVSDEAISGGFGMQGFTRAAAPHDWLQLMGGAIGQGLPLATGAAIACPDRKVVCLEADGSALYTFQSLWTQAREGLDVTTVVFANRRYAILEAELERVGATAGPLARSQYAIDAPTLDFVRLAEAQGVPAAHADDAETFHRRLAEALAEPGPRLIEARVGGS